MNIAYIESFLSSKAVTITGAAVMFAAANALALASHRAKRLSAGVGRRR